MSSLDLDEKHEPDSKHGHILEVSTKGIDVAAELIAGDAEGVVDPAEAERVRSVICSFYPICHLFQTKD